MKTIKIPWASWYDDTIKNLTITNNWNVNYCNIKDGKKINKESIINSIRNPIKRKKISEIARNKKKVIILIDDLTRKTPTKLIFPYILTELKKANISNKQISLLVANGAHRPLNRIDLAKKIGNEYVNRFRTLNHCPYENNVFLGKSSNGTPIYINKYFLDSDFKIAIGSILPHYNTGFSGGCKIVVPGCAGIETIKANHKILIKNMSKNILYINENKCRKDIEEITMKIGLDFIVNIVPNSKYEIAGIFTGHPILAHREGVKFAYQILCTKLPPPSDVAIFNSYPGDIELTQLLKSLNVYYSSKKPLVKEDGIVIITSACSEGVGTHYLYQEGMPLYYDWWEFLEGILNGSKLVIFTPNLSKYDVEPYFSKKVEVYNNWRELIKKVNNYYKMREINVNIFPISSIQFIKE